MMPTPAAGVSCDSASGIETRTAISRSVWHAPRIAVPRQSATALRSVRRLMGVETVNAPAQGDSLRGTRAKGIALLAVLQLTSAALFPGRSTAQVQSVDTLIPAKPVGYVNDFAHLLNPSEAAPLETLLRRLQAATGAELAVVTLGNIGEQDEADVA